MAVVGLVRDDHLESWTLRFGAGEEPADFATIALGQVGGDGIPLGAWDVRFVPDGVYTLSLVAVDRAGLTAESRVVVTLDGLPPTTTLSSPKEGGYVRLPGPVVGAVTDANLVGWDLEVAPGAAATAYQWLAARLGPKASVDGGARRVVAPPARRGLHAEADRAGRGGTDREHAVDRDRRHDAPGRTHRPRREGHAGQGRLRPRRGDVEREHRAGPRGLPDRAAEGGVGRSCSPARRGTTGSGWKAGTPTASWPRTRRATRARPRRSRCSSTSRLPSSRSRSRRPTRGWRARSTCAARRTAPTTSGSSGSSSEPARAPSPGRSCAARRCRWPEGSSASGSRSWTGPTSWRSRRRTRTATRRA